MIPMRHLNHRVVQRFDGDAAMTRECRDLGLLLDTTFDFDLMEFRTRPISTKKSMNAPMTDAR